MSIDYSFIAQIAFIIVILLTYNAWRFRASVNNKKFTKYFDSNPELSEQQRKEMFVLYSVATTWCFTMCILLFGVFTGFSTKKRNTQSTYQTLPKNAQKVIAHVAFSRSPITFIVVVILFTVVSIFKEKLLLILAASALIVTPTYAGNISTKDSLKQQLDIAICKTFNRYKDVN